MSWFHPFSLYQLINVLYRYGAFKSSLYNKVPWCHHNKWHGNDVKWWNRFQMVNWQTYCYTVFTKVAIPLISPDIVCAIQKYAKIYHCTWSEWYGISINKLFRDRMTQLVVKMFNRIENFCKNLPLNKLVLCNQYPIQCNNMQILKWEHNTKLNMIY